MAVSSYSTNGSLMEVFHSLHPTVALLLGRGVSKQHRILDRFRREIRVAGTWEIRFRSGVSWTAIGMNELCLLNQFMRDRRSASSAKNCLHAAKRRHRETLFAGRSVSKRAKPMTSSTPRIEIERGGIVPDAVVLDLYRKMLTVFYVEERLKIFDRLGKVSFHASARGHIKLQIGMTLLLKPRQDWFFTYYREKGIAIGLGMSLKDIFLGMLSRHSDPNSAGRNMPEHWSSRELRLVAQTAATGTQFLPAVGLARAVKCDGGSDIVYVSSGEGATSEGEFFEALNWATRERLPVLFVIQNNGYAISVPQPVQTSSEIHRIAQGFGMPSYSLDGTWFEPMYETLPPVIERTRQGGGPALVEAQVIRMDSHSSSDDQKKYRSQEELNAMIERDPIYQTERYLQRHRILGEKQMQEMREQTKAAVDQAADEADQEPAPRTDGLLAHIYAAASSDVSFTGNALPEYVSEEPISLIEAINRGLREEMALNPKIVIWGEDIADPKGGVFGVTWA
jgi:2-oxoisovalerate dehydrogenase E1 component